MTYTQIEELVKLVTGNIALNLRTLLLNVENEFIEETFCTQAEETLVTSDLNGGVLSERYDLPADFLIDYVVHWDGYPIINDSIQNQDSIFDTSGEIIDGCVYRYLIEDDQIRLMPKPSQHGRIHIWYCKKNTATTGTSPIIPATEHRKLANGVIRDVYKVEEFENIQKAEYYDAKFKEDLDKAYSQYYRQRNSQTHIYDRLRNNFGGIQSRLNDVSE